MLRTLVLLSCVVIAAACRQPEPSPAQPPVDREAEIDAIVKLMEEYVEAINDPTFMAGTREQRRERLQRFYRDDAAAARDDAPLYFGPLTEPVARGTQAHLDNTLANFEFLARNKVNYGLRIDESQIEVDGALAAVLALTTNGYASPDGKINYVARGRSSLVLHKVTDRWVITHEHIEMFNPQNPSSLPRQQLEAEIQKIQ